MREACALQCRRVEEIHAVLRADGQHLPAAAYGNRQALRPTNDAGEGTHPTGRQRTVRRPRPLPRVRSSRPASSAGAYRWGGQRRPLVAIIASERVHRGRQRLRPTVLALGGARATLSLRLSGRDRKMILGRQTERLTTLSSTVLEWRKERQRYEHECTPIQTVRTKTRSEERRCSVCVNACVCVHVCEYGESVIRRRSSVSVEAQGGRENRNAKLVYHHP